MKPFILFLNHIVRRHEINYSIVLSGDVHKERREYGITHGHCGIREFEVVVDLFIKGIMVTGFPPVLHHLTSKFIKNRKVGLAGGRG